MTVKRLKVFSSSWCAPCKVLKTMVLPKLRDDGWLIEEIDIDDPANESECKAKNIRGIPTCMVYDGEGNHLKTFVGSTTKSKFDEVFK